MSKYLDLFKLIFVLALVCYQNNLYADSLANETIHLSQKEDQILLDAQAILPMTETMKAALMHGIALEYTLETRIGDNKFPTWWHIINQQQTRVRLSYDLLKQTYILTNLSLKRVTNDRDLQRSLASLGTLRDQPIAQTQQLETGHEYLISVTAKLEATALPNALRLSSLFDEQWRKQSPTLSRSWIAPNL